MEYKEYKETIITAGEAIRMERQHSLDDFDFKKSFNKQMSVDINITSDQVLSIMFAFNVYYELDIILMLNHPNLSSVEVQDIVNSGLNPGDLKKYFLTKLMTYDNLITRTLVDKTFKYGSQETDVAVLRNPKTVELAAESLILETLDGYKNDIEFVDIVKTFDHLTKYFIHLYEVSGVGIYLPDTVTDIFLF